MVNNKWSQSDHTFSFTFIRFHPLSFIFIHFVHFHPLSSTCIHFHSLSSIFIHFILFTHFHPFPPPFYPLPSTFINFHSLSSTFIHIHPPSALQVVGKWSASNRQVVGKWSASGRQVVGKWSQLVKVCSGIESFGTLKPISGRDGWMDGWDGYIEHYVC